jgi:hypothetical protein
MVFISLLGRRQPPRIQSDSKLEFTHMALAQGLSSGLVGQMVSGAAVAVI